MKALTWLFVALVLGGCAAQAPLRTVRTEASPAAPSEKSASLELVTGAFAGPRFSTFVPAGTIFIPLSSGPDPALQFHAGDQREFMDALQAELLRLGVFRRVATSGDRQGTDLTISVVFAQTQHRSHDQEYTLDVVMSIEGGSKSFLRQYRINSNEGASPWERMTTSAHEGKVKAVRQLLEKLIPDIQGHLVTATQSPTRKVLHQEWRWEPDGLAPDRRQPVR